MSDGWLSVLDAEDRATFVAEMREALDRAEDGGDMEPAERCIREWQATAEVLRDPAALAILTAPVIPDEDLAEVMRPGSGAQFGELVIPQEAGDA